ncbi:hypothetical protein [Thermocoleostomius sinensis]|jgi:hypothetical protein|uniref:Uncharacterized protein n=1 Tax=Thermocoleostomius sinensis A174 TaxID=2016057 RepID=A0A9E8ZAM7_9CYAN|nr:hypothetical protein [Thermocoleostomius sinensis]WAL59638.1 hypothetical protein OXH18_21080 [Thermocoleostomius sinensis A174]
MTSMTSRTSTVLLNRSTWTTIDGEPAVALEHMPDSWQRIAQATWMTEPGVYTAMAQVFLAKNLGGHILFLERSDTQHLREAYCTGNGKLAWEAVYHYGEMFLPENYPDLSQLRHEVQCHPMQQTERIALVNIVSDLFDALGYDVPATFYWTFLHPLQRSDVFEVRSFRFSEQDLGIARQFDAILHGGYVSMLRRLIDSISSRHGFFIEHGCGCENHLAKLKPCDSSFDYRLPPEMRSKTLRAFFWSILEEYMLFEQRSATRLVYKSV